MIEKTELRIGNLLKPAVSAEMYLVVKGITDTGIHFADGRTFDFKLVEPIVLTAEILTKSDFIYGRKYCSPDFYDFKKIASPTGNWAWEFRRNNESLRNIKYVHQAQNLFYQVSGEELKIKF